MTDDAVVRQIAQKIVSSRQMVVLVGAGSSTESGIPDFRSPGGVWDRFDPEEFTYQNFIASEQARENAWQLARETYAVIKTAHPNPAHLALVELERMGLLDCLITQNIDGLHFLAGNSPEKVIEIHGTVRYVICLSCGKRYNRDEIETRLASGVKVPRCDDCHGLLKTATVSFGQSMPERETAEAFRRAAECDLFMCIGSSLVVHPAAQLPIVAKDSGACLVIINREPTVLDNLADIVYHGLAGETMERIMTYVREWKS